MGGGEHRWGGGIGIGIGIAPISTMVAPLNNAEREEYYWRHVNSSMNAVSFGFVATAILISMFLIMAIFEKFLRPRSSSSSSSSSSLPTRNRLDLEAQMVYGGKHDFPSPKMTVYARGVSVLMPGEEIPTFIAHPAPVPCPPEQIKWPPHQHNTCFGPSSTANSTRNQM